MLAQPAEDIADALARLGTAALEWKVDGARVQVQLCGVPRSCRTCLRSDNARVTWPISYGSCSHWATLSAQRGLQRQSG